MSMTPKQARRARKKHNRKWKLLLIRLRSKLSPIPSATLTWWQKLWGLFKCKLGWHRWTTNHEQGIPPLADREEDPETYFRHKYMRVYCVRCAKEI